MDQVEVTKAARHKELPISIHTAYKWHSLKKYPELLYKVAGKLFFDRDEWQEMSSQAKQKQVSISVQN